MSRVALLIEYDGTAYAGWQRQQNAVSVQQCLEEALQGLTGRHIPITGASRTDAGVHARGQVAHLDPVGSIPAERYALALNTHLPPDIRVRHSARVSPSFHARYHAAGKRYVYIFTVGRAAPAIGRQYATHVPGGIDFLAMSSACGDIIGTYDFTGLCASGGAVRDKVRTVHACTLSRMGDAIALTVEGSGFLYNMVRIIAGTLIDIGRGKLPGDALAQAVLRRDRMLAGATAPARGLCLECVRYPGGMLPWTEDAGTG